MLKYLKIGAYRDSLTFRANLKKRILKIWSFPFLGSRMSHWAQRCLCMTARDSTVTGGASKQLWHDAKRPSLVLNHIHTGTARFVYVHTHLHIHTQLYTFGLSFCIFPSCTRSRWDNQAVRHMCLLKIWGVSMVDSTEWFHKNESNYNEVFDGHIYYIICSMAWFSFLFMQQSVLTAV